MNRNYRFQIAKYIYSLYEDIAEVDENGGNFSKLETQLSTIHELYEILKDPERFYKENKKKINDVKLPDYMWGREIYSVGYPAWSNRNAVVSLVERGIKYEVRSNPSYHSLDVDLYLKSGLPVFITLSEKDTKLFMALLENFREQFLKIIQFLSLRSEFYGMPLDETILDMFSRRIDMNVQDYEREYRVSLDEIFKIYMGVGLYPCSDSSHQYIIREHMNKDELAELILPKVTQLQQQYKCV